MAFVGILAFLVFIACVIGLIVATFRKRSKKRWCIGIGVCFTLFVGTFVMSPTPEKTVATPEPKQEVAASKEEKRSAEPTKDSSNQQQNIDFDKVIADTTSALTNKENFPYVKDIYFKVDQDKKEITMTAALGDSTKPEIALEFADTMIRRFAFNAQLEDSSLKSPSKDYYGGLYDEYKIFIGIAPLSQQENKKKWYVEKIIQQGMHTKQAPTLNKIYKK